MPRSKIKIIPKLLISALEAGHDPIFCIITGYRDIIICASVLGDH